MDILALNQAIYWLLWTFAILGVVLTTLKAVENNVWLWLFHPNMMSCGACFYWLAYFVCPLIWLAIAVLKGFVLYEAGYAVWSSVGISILIGVAYPLALLAVCIATVSAVLLLIGLYYLLLWLGYGICGEINKAKKRRQARKRAKKAKNQ